MSAPLVIYLSMLVALGVYATHRVFLTVLAFRARVGSEPQVATESDTRVTVQLPIFNERFVAERLVAAAAALRWPRDRLQIQILDDSTDDTAELCSELAERYRALGVDISHHHRSDRHGFKAGALEAGMATATGDVILILDADFVPPVELLEQMVPHFDNQRVGMVQVRWEHLNRDYSMLTEVQALLLDGHFGVEQTARSRNGRFFNFNGTAGAWRREAIESAGGWQHDTLTEDLDLSYRALLAGWEFRYLPEITAPAELPVPMSGFKSQQFRWAKGSVQVARKLLPRVLLDRRLSVGQRVEAFFHLTQNVPYLLTAILALASVPALALGERPTTLAFVSIEVALLVGTVGTLALYCAASQRATGGGVIAALVRLPALIAVTAGISISQSRAVLEGAFGTESGFVRTPKSGIVSRGDKAPARYRNRVGLIPLAEVMLSVYFAFGIWMAAAGGRFLAMPALMLFALGFGYVGARSLARR